MHTIPTKTLKDFKFDNFEDIDIDKYKDVEFVTVTVDNFKNIYNLFSQNKRNEINNIVPIFANYVCSFPTLYLFKFFVSNSICFVHETYHKARLNLKDISNLLQSEMDKSAILVFSKNQWNYILENL